MYVLHFNKNRSKNFPEALSFARELDGSFNGQTVKVAVSDEYLLSAYSTFRTLFGIIQRWKSTRATYRGNPVHPYQFILKMNRVRECALESEDTGCGNQWSCQKLTALNHNVHKFGISWFNIGHFKEEKWIINKDDIKTRLLNQSELLGVDICPSFDETELLTIIRSLPDYIVPDGFFYDIVYKEMNVKGRTFRIKENVRKLRNEQPQIKPSYPLLKT